MKKILGVFVVLLFSAQNAAFSVVIKKSASVATKQVEKKDAMNSLLPTVMTLVQGAQALGQQQKALTAECVPTGSEINWVNDMVKEWAKTGAMTADEVQTMLNQSPCIDGNTYKSSVQIAGDTNDASDICYDTFKKKSDEGTVWYGFPKAAKEYYCSDGELSCSERYRKEVSNIYEIFSLIDFTQADYTASEWATASKIMEKFENCSTVKLNARKKEAMGNFLANTVGGLGQKTNTGSVMEMVQSVTSGMGGGGGFNLGGLTNVAGQLFQQ